MDVFVVMFKDLGCSEGEIIDVCANTETARKTIDKYCKSVGKIWKLGVEVVEETPYAEFAMRLNFLTDENKVARIAYVTYETWTVH